MADEKNPVPPSTAEIELQQKIDYEGPNEYGGPCEECGDEAEWGAWNIPENATCYYCVGCGGLIGVDYN